MRVALTLVWTGTVVGLELLGASETVREQYSAISQTQLHIHKHMVAHTHTQHTHTHMNTHTHTCMRAHINMLTSSL